MLNIINRKPFITKRSRELGKLEFELAMHWLNTMEQLSVDSLDDKVTCMTFVSAHMNKAAKYLGFTSVAEMNRYYQKHKQF